MRIFSPGLANVADGFGPSLPGLQVYRPSQLYHLIDEARLKLHPLAEVRNLAEALFRLEPTYPVLHTSRLAYS